MEYQPVTNRGQPADRYAEVTRDLVSLIERDPELESLLERSIRKAATVNDDPETNPVRSLPEYCEFVDETYKLVPERILQAPAALTRDRLLQAISYFYFLIDQELPELADRDLYRPTVQYYEPFADWLRDFVEAWGAFLDTEDSWNDEVYQQFRADPRFNLDNGWYESPENWETFNEFFGRRLRSPGVRPITEGESVVVSPADSVPMGSWEIDGDGRFPGDLRLKSVEYHEVSDLLADDSEYGDAFAGGTFTHTFLNVHDYHRYHFPVGGTVVETAIIRDNVAMEVGWNTDEQAYEPVSSVGWQFCQTRGYALVDTGEYGLVACLPIGMAHVSSVTFEDDVQVGETFEKGDPLGAFYFGGSDFVLLFQEQAGFELVAPNTDLSDGDKRAEYDHLKMGERYGVLRG